MAYAFDDRFITLRWSLEVAIVASEVRSLGKRYQRRRMPQQQSQEFVSDSEQAEAKWHYLATSNHNPRRNVVFVRSRCVRRFCGAGDPHFVIFIVSSRWFLLAIQSITPSSISTTLPTKHAVLRSLAFLDEILSFQLDMLCGWLSASQFEPNDGCAPVHIFSGIRSAINVIISNRER
jgi:hypothetical protein